MATMTIEYNERDRHVMQILAGLTGSGIIRCKNAGNRSEIAAFKTALQETGAMAADIARNGTAGYKTLGDLLSED